MGEFSDDHGARGGVGWTDIYVRQEATSRRLEQRRCGRLRRCTVTRLRSHEAVPQLLSMNENKRPLSVTMLACLYLVVGTVGVAYHFSEFLAFRYDSVEVELMEVLPIVSGAFLLRGHNW